MNGILNENVPVSCFSAAEKQHLLTRLYDLLSWQATRYLAGDSSSLPVETAEELLRSLLYTLRLALAASARPERALLTCDLQALLRQGQQLLQAQLPKTKTLWQQVCLTAPPVRNVYLSDTLRDLAAFWKQYDAWYFAHQIPCSINYPLCSPVAETLQGITYIEQWLQRLLMENWFLSKFPPRAICRLLATIAPDYPDCPMNLCEPVLIHVTGSALLQGELTPTLSSAAVGALTTMLCTAAEPTKLLQGGLARVLATLQAPEPTAKYFEAVLADLFPRLRSALPTGALRGIFFCQP